MKYLYAGAGILLACLILCLTVTAALDRCMGQTAARLEQAREQGEAGNFEEAARRVEEASALWNEKKGFFGIALRHDQLDEVGGSFCRLRAYAGDANGDEFGPGCDELIETLRHLAEMEKPYYYNVL